MRKLRKAWTGTVLFLALFALGMPRLAAAGCGCDHPPPDWSVVQPSFGAPDKLVQIWADGGSFLAGAAYEVKFDKKRVSAVAVRPDRLGVTVPHGLKPGPTPIEVKGPGYERKYDAALFTALPRATRVPKQALALRADKFRTAVTANGTLLIPVDLSSVRDATQFAILLGDLPLAFGGDDVVIYNTAGVDLTLFTLAVADATQRQWGSYYGWQVEEDTGLSGLVYEHKVKKSALAHRESDVFTYWRHEFHTYARAHGPGGSHHVDADGFHPDGTFHIDHDHIVIAIHGRVRDAKEPTNTAKMRALAAGDRMVDLRVFTVPAAQPLEPDAVVEAGNRGLALIDDDQMTCFGVNKFEVKIKKDRLGEDELKIERSALALQSGQIFDLTRDVVTVDLNDGAFRHSFVGSDFEHSGSEWKLSRTRLNLRRLLDVSDLDVKLVLGDAWGRDAHRVLVEDSANEQKLSFEAPSKLATRCAP
jgi:hypothetical protein